MTKQVNQSTLNVILVAALSVTTTLAMGGGLYVLHTSNARQDKSDLKHDATLAALQALDTRVTVLETKQQMAE